MEFDRGFTYPLPCSFHDSGRLPLNEFPARVNHAEIATVGSRCSRNMAARMIGWQSSDCEPRDHRKGFGPAAPLLSNFRIAGAISGRRPGLHAQSEARPVSRPARGYLRCPTASPVRPASGIPRIHYSRTRADLHIPYRRDRRRRLPETASALRRAADVSRHLPYRYRWSRQTGRSNRGAAASFSGRVGSIA